MIDFFCKSMAANNVCDGRKQVLASSQNNFLSLHQYDNVIIIGLAGLSNRGS